jgi:hypothetical protein
MPCNRAAEFDLDVLFREPDSPECREFVDHSGGCEDCTAAIAARGTAQPPGTSRRPTLVVTGVAVVALGVVAWLALPDRPGEPGDATGPAAAQEPTPDAEPAPDDEAAAGQQPAPPVEVPPAASAAGVDPIDSVTLEPSEERVVAAAALPRGRPFGLSLRVPVVDAGVDALAIRILADDGRVLELMGAVAAGDRELASTSVKADWLNRPGRYIVEIKTTEKSHFPLRRYAIEVR